MEEPTFWETCLDWGLNHLLMKSIHREYVKKLGLTGNENLLDVGCGSGAFTQHVAEAILMGQGRITCVDSSETWLKIARKRLAKREFLHFVQSKIETAPLPDKTYTAVLIHCTLCQTNPNHRQSLVNASARRLMRGGVLYIKESTSVEKGIQPVEIRRLMEQALMKEISFEMGYTALQGPTYQGVFRSAAG